MVADLAGMSYSFIVLTDALQQYADGLPAHGCFASFCLQQSMSVLAELGNGREYNSKLCVLIK